MDAHKEVIRRLGERFHFQPDTLQLLKNAFCHRSWINEFKSVPGGAAIEANERLEFLGDSILGFVVAKTIYQQLPQADEGALSKVKSQLVSAPMLAKFARELELGNALLVGRGEEASGGRERDSLLANTLEALIGAIFLGEGINTAEGFIRELWREEFEKNTAGFADIDYKTQLQEYAQKTTGALPVYVVEKTSGPDHRRFYEMSVTIGGVIRGQGKGTSKKQAAQAAAAAAYENITKPPL